MRQVWVGVAKTLDFEDLIVKYIDPLFIEQGIEEVPKALLVTEFGASKFEPGTFEVYARSNYQDQRFDATLFQELAPFAQIADGLARMDDTNATCMFFVMCKEQPTKRSDDEITITDVINVVFDWDAQG